MVKNTIIVVLIFKTYTNGKPKQKFMCNPVGGHTNTHLIRVRHKGKYICRIETKH